MKFISFLITLIQCLLRITIITALYSCNNRYGNFMVGSSYGNNRDVILSSLHTNSTANAGSYSGSIGTGNSQVYVLSFCWGDSNRGNCAACLNATGLGLIQHCPNQKKALSWGAADQPCTIRYSDSPIHGTLEQDPRLMYTNDGNLTTNQTEFDQNWRSFSRGLVIDAGSSSSKYATSELNLADTTIFALSQCSPDLLEADCLDCLLSSMDDYHGCCNGKNGGLILMPSCIFRWALYSFYTSTHPSPPSPLQSPLDPSSSVSLDKRGTKISSTVIIILVVALVFAMVLSSVIFIFFFKIRRRKKLAQRIENEVMGGFSTVDSLQFDFGTLRAATDGFSEVRKLGQGGFGAVYMGMLLNGQEIAVKRLASNSGQGELEFKNEVMLLARLQHKNLVRLLGFCQQGRERLLIYEYVPNSSLDHFLFDPIKRGLLDWETRHRIIIGIARGLLYLHEDSRLRIIHRDMKTSNILLDQGMNPKISDFGMARLFTHDQTGADTNRIVGTYGYMSPEYAMHGNFSVKSDVYSFGVVVLEIVSGMRNNSSLNGGRVEYLINSAWKNWREGTISNIIDPSLSSGLREELARCLHIGLLCVQEIVANRPTMASVVLMLNNHSMILQVPTRPGFLNQNGIESNILSRQDNNASTSSKGNRRRSCRKNEF